MKKIFFIGFLFLSIASQAQTFPSRDSLIKFVNKYIRTSVIESYKNMRLNTALKGIINEIDSAVAGANAFDSTYIYALTNTKAPLLRTITINGNTQTLEDDRMWTIPTADTTSLSDRINLKVDKIAGKGLSTEDYSTIEKTKLAGIAANATANSSDAILLNRVNHTGTQVATTITEDATHRFTTDAEKTSWNAKQNAIALGTTAQYFRGDLSLATFPTSNTAFTNGAGYLVAADITGKVNLAGAAGGQTINGGTASGENLTLVSTAHATKGKILFGTSGYDEVNNRLGVGTASPGLDLDIQKQVFAGGVWGRVYNSANSGYAAFSIGTNTNANKVNIYGFGNTYSSSGQYQANQSLFEVTGSMYLTATDWRFHTGSVVFNGGTSAPAASAQVEIISTTKGFLPPRMTTTERDAIASPAAALMVYDNTVNKFSGRSASSWGYFSLEGHTHAATDITQDATHRFATDAEKTSWNAKQDALTTASDVSINTAVLTDYTSNSAPAAPGNGLKIYSKQQAGKNILSYIGENGKPFNIQEAFYSARVAFLAARNGDATIDGFGLRQVTNVASTAVAVTSAFNGNLFASLRRVSLSSTATVSTTGGIRNNALGWTLGDAAGKGGFLFDVEGGINTNISNGRAFIGFLGQTASTGNVDPSSLANVIGFGFDATDTDWFFMHNDGSGTATRVALGSAGQFPRNTASTDWYQFRIYAPPNSTTVSYSILRVNTGDYVENSVSTNLPASTQGLAYQISVNNNSTASAMILDFGQLYIGTEN